MGDVICWNCDKPIEPGVFGSECPACSDAAYDEAQQALASEKARADRAEAERDDLAFNYRRLNAMLEEWKAIEAARRVEALGEGARFAQLEVERDAARAESSALRVEVERLTRAATDAATAKERVLDCHAGPGTAEPACGACNTCLEAQVEALRGALVDLTNHLDRVWYETDPDAGYPGGVQRGDPHPWVSKEVRALLSTLPAPQTKEDEHG